jgi:hypothetical protein
MQIAPSLRRGELPSVVFLSGSTLVFHEGTKFPEKIIEHKMCVSIFFAPSV